MSNAIVVLNLNSYLTSNARDSFEAAATRWGCSFEEITTEPKATQIRTGYVPEQKLGIPDAMDGEHDRVFQVDADCLIRSTAPNPFDLFADTSKVYGVPYIDQRRNMPSLYAIKKLSGVVTAKQARVRSGYVGPSSTWNVGVMLYSPTSYAAALDSASVDDLLDSENDIGYEIEELIHNHVAGANFEAMPQDWNVWTTDLSDVRGHVMHFRGFASLAGTWDWS
jgi:hypothetical protein